MKFHVSRVFVALLTLLALVTSTPNALVAQQKPYTIHVIIPMTAFGAALGAEPAVPADHQP